MTIWACQAGKDVYVEKPISHNIVEGRRMIEAARRYNRVVAVGTQRRSGAVLAKAVQFLRDGGLGTVYAGKTVVYRSAGSDRRGGGQPGAAGRELRPVARAGAVAPVQREPLPLPLALVLGIRHERSRQHRRAFARRRALAARQSRSIRAPRTASAACTRPARRPIRRRRTRSTPPISMPTAPSSTATCATGSAARPRPRASTSSARKAG